jgi:hypothetical protein
MVSRSRTNAGFKSDPTGDQIPDHAQAQSLIGDIALWGAESESIGFAVDNREPRPLSYTLGLVGHEIQCHVRLIPEV